MFAQVDQEGHRLKLLDEFLDHRFTGASVQEVRYVKTKDGKRKLQEPMSTNGCEILVQWRDGTQTWNKMKDIKEAYPVELAEYTVKAKIHKQSQFDWWVKKVLKKREAIVKKVKSKYWERTHKYGIRIPKDVQEAKDLD